MGRRYPQPGEGQAAARLGAVLRRSQRPFRRSELRGDIDAKAAPVTQCRQHMPGHEGGGIIDEQRAIAFFREVDARRADHNS